MDRATTLYPVLLEHVTHLRVGKLIFTDKATNLQWKMLLQRDGDQKQTFARQLQTFLMDNMNPVDPCPLCSEINCHRNIAIQVIRQVLQTQDVEWIPHPVLRF